MVEKLAAVSEDRDRERLLTLRYRLAASEALVLGWPGGLARLASSDTGLRHRAASELVERATTAEEPLLLELFADADPLVREISLRGLDAVGTEASSTTLVKLLDDPQPNVRAAVLKQLAESPNAAIIPQISAYLKTETDPDLVVHGVRVLKAAAARGNLIELLKHSSWQVRAEAAEALGGLTVKNPNQQMAADVYAALIETLSDPDPFVVSRAVQGLRRSNLATAVEPLAKAAAEHPELAAEVIGILTQGNFQSKTQTVLRGYLDHADPKVRAEVIAALATPVADDVGELVEARIERPGERSPRRHGQKAARAVRRRRSARARPGDRRIGAGGSRRSAHPQRHGGLRRAVVWRSRAQACQGRHQTERRRRGGRAESRRAGRGGRR